MDARSRTAQARARADTLTGRALALALRPGLEPGDAVEELVALADGTAEALDQAWARLRGLALEATSPTLQLALDLLAEAVGEVGRALPTRVAVPPALVDLSDGAPAVRI